MLLPEPADRAGLTSGDVIVQVDKQEVHNIASLGDVLLSKKPGDVVLVQVHRANQHLTITVELGELTIE